MKRSSFLVICLGLALFRNFAAVDAEEAATAAQQQFNAVAASLADRKPWEESDLTAYPDNGVARRDTEG